MVTNETKNGRKFIKMYDPETGEYLGPLVNMTHEEAHGKKPEGTLEIKIDKEAWDKLKYEHDVDGDHKEIEDRVNYETTQRFYLPKFHFKRPE